MKKITLYRKECYETHYGWPIILQMADKDGNAYMGALTIIGFAFIKVDEYDITSYENGSASIYDLFLAHFLFNDDDTLEAYSGNFNDDDFSALTVEHLAIDYDYIQNLFNDGKLPYDNPNPKSN